jgi:hypothetical protein
MNAKTNINLNPNIMENTIKTTATVIEITVLQLVMLIESLRPSMFVSITQVTNARLRVRSAKNDGIFDPKGALKVSTLNTHSGISYENKVKAMTNDENFKAGEAFYTIESDNKMLAKGKKNPNQFYFLYSGFQNTNARTKYLIDNKIVSKFNLSEDTLPKVYNRDDRPVWRAVKVENIKRINVNGQRYKVVS